MRRAVGMHRAFHARSVAFVVMRSRFVAIAVALVAVIAVVGCGGGGDDQTYSDDTRASFLEPCIAGLGESGRDVCECSYDLIADDIPFAEFEDVDRALQGNPDAALPDDIADIVAACAADPTAARERAQQEQEQQDQEEQTTTTPLP
jgi:hypothetical protein